MKSVSASLFGLSMVAVSTFATVQSAVAQSVGSAPTVMIVNGEQYIQPVTRLSPPMRDTKNVPMKEVSIDELMAGTTPMSDAKAPMREVSIDELMAGTTPMSDAKAPMREVSMDELIAGTTPMSDAKGVPMEELTVVTASTPSMPANALEARSDIPVQYIQASPEGSRLKGDIRGLEVDIYHFLGQQGQTVHIVHNKSNPAIEAAIFSPSMGMNFGSSYMLPESGDYELRIVQTRQDAARNKTPRYYDIVFQVQ